MVGSNTVGEDFADVTPVEKKEPTPFDEAGSRQQWSSSTLEDDGQLCVSSIEHQIWYCSPREPKSG